MILKESIILPPRILLCDQVIQPTDFGRIRWKRLEEKAILTIPPHLASTYEERLTKLSSEMEAFQRKLTQTSHTPEEVTRETIKHLFPCAAIAVREKREGVLFHRSRMEEYVNQAFNHAKMFRTWIYGDHLPTTLHQVLGLPEELEMSEFTESIRYIANETNESSLSSIVRSDVFQHDLFCLYQLTLLHGLVDLATDPEDEKLLEEFVNLESRTFVGFEDKMSLSVQLDKRGIPVNRRMSWVARDDALITAQSESRKRTAIIPCTVRKMSNYPYDYVIMEHRGKTKDAEELKIIRGAELPVKDKSGVRFILWDHEMLDSFLVKLKQDFPGWIFKKDTDEPSEESSLEYAVKYFAWKKDDPHHRVEIQIDWLTRKGLFQGSYIPKMLERGKTHAEYRMRQLLKIFPRMFPKELYGIDWKNPETRRILFQFAYSKATGLSPELFDPYEL